MNGFVEAKILCLWHAPNLYTIKFVRIYILNVVPEIW